MHSFIFMDITAYPSNFSSSCCIRMDTPVGSSSMPHTIESSMTPTTLRSSLFNTFLFAFISDYSFKLIIDPVTST
ncbi:hypothetical protein M2105_005324 [Paenibacillus sp. PastF-1]|nr:hypothetical protein [Paenibacillus sp. PastF-2]MDF9850943.1 hypothetical protein [Paenibacillus sp. PastM-2]MDF9857443.1 hypothetical protein [Paenibacillus sp. PastF-1]MDH6482781.1 hypothetical protein [Paenibacillus sp. PastH-2]MDH6510207.1 hypothetical protein [Paenibacillus sp. PastM-3]